MVVGVKDQTGCHNLIRRKDVNLALAQFAFIFQKHEFLMWTGFKRAAYQFKLGTGQNNLWKEIFIITEKKNP